MPKMTQKNSAGKALVKSSATTISRLMSLLISVLATPFNLIFIGLRIIWSGRRLRLAAIALTLVAVTALIFRVESFSPVADMVRGQTHKTTASAGFKVNDITVEGRKRTQRKDLLAAIDIGQNDPIFAIDLPSVHARIEALPWVEKAVVLRRLPNIIHIDLTEREPFAFYKAGNDSALIDRKGVTITRHHLAPFGHLPVFSGKGATLRASAFMEMLQAYPVLRNRMVAAHWNSGRRWTVTLDHGGQVHLPAHGVSGALDRLMVLEKERRVLAIENQAIDLRLPDRVLLRPANERSSVFDRAQGGSAS
ncbi:MAG: FtsQ-type POTRA domain-containing protein [PS1 clade bacterium]|uniref:Cell division protein FtsQ n=1 Tax=PS1 clade bacterium TaxID=2175152 RepID=A0A937L3J4_9PROT|nr:FtsQ-type POTRA domain-containing protein [PS1 clade bacterium]